MSRAASGSFPARQPTRTASATPLSLTTNNFKGVKGGHGDASSAGGFEGREVDDAFNLPSGVLSGYPRTADVLSSAATQSSLGPSSIGSKTLRETSSPATPDARAVTRSKHDRKGRPKMWFIDGAEVASTSDGSTLGSTEEMEDQIMPFPPRPGKESTSRSKQLQQAIHSVHHVRTKRATGIPGIVNKEAPQDAKKYPEGKVADFAPWTGDAAEDHLTDKLIKGGFQSTPLVSIQDTNVARHQLWPNLKNRSGIHTLSSIFCNVLERRQQSGKVTAPSTFKPPPRVALTDKSRETWLLELANPSVPLRRLSRRIPHGIRGKGLLEECLTKNIPPSRAVWLAKCVGANEMRAFKRKGAGTATATSLGGEAKWVREWTMQVQLFLEGVVNGCGQSDWRSKIQYAVRLATFLYSELLLDQDQYLDWILTSLESSPSERLPFWLLISQIYWKDLTCVRRRGKRLAQALLSHLSAMTTPDNEGVDLPIVKRLRQNLAVLSVKHRACLIIPKSWSQYKSTLQSLRSWDQHPMLASAIDNISARNDALSSTAETDTKPRYTPRRMLLEALDEFLLDLSQPSELQNLSATCLECDLAHDQTIATVLRWGATMYRCGEHRVYVVIRLLRKWKTAGLDTDSALLSFLEQEQSDKIIEQGQIFKIIAELCRSHHFAVGKYMQWLIASGLTTSSDESGTNTNPHKLLLAQIPASGLPDYLANLRTTLLQGFGVTEDSDTDEAATLKERIRSMVMQPGISSEALGELNLQEHNLSLRYELSRWLRQETESASQLVPVCSKDCEEDLTELRISTISARQLIFIRTALEQLGDLAVLADVLAITVTSNETTVLCAIADTLNLHSRTFAAIGALRPLFKQLTERYGQVRATQPLERPLVFSIYDLARNIGSDNRLVQQLNADLERCEQRAAVAMCSPASDGMGELTYSSKADLSPDEEIERVLNSGTNIDEPSAGRVFNRIVSRMAEQIGELKEISAESDTKTVSPYDSWFQKLRAFDERVFERLMNDWITNSILEEAPDSSLLAFALPTAVGAGVADLGKSLQSAMIMAQKISKIDKRRASSASLNLLMAMIPEGLEPHTLVEPEYQYRFAIERQKLETLFTHELRGLVDAVIRGGDEKFTHKVTELICLPGSMSYLKQAAVKDVQALTQALQLGKSGSSQSSPIEILLYELLRPNAAEERAMTHTKGDSIRRIIMEADDFSLPFCQLQIEYLLSSSGDVGTADSQTKSNDASSDAALLDAIKCCMDRDDNSWAELLSGFGQNIIRKVREYAEEQILAESHDFTEQMKHEGFKLASDNWSVEMQQQRRYIGIVDLTMPDATKSSSSDRSILVVFEQLRAIIEVLQQSDPASGPGYTFLQMICSWVEVLLHLAVLHQGALSTLPAVEHSSMLAVLCSLLTLPQLQQFRATVEHAFDVLGLISDVLSPELRASAAKSEIPKSNGDSRLIFIFGPSATPEAWLGLVTSMSSLTTAATSTPKSTAAAASSPAPASPAPKQAQVQSQSAGPQQAPSPTPTPSIQRQNSQQNLAQAQMLQRQNSQQRLQQQAMQPPSNLPPRPGMPMGRGGLTQYGQALPQQQVQARQAQQAWPQTQQNKMQHLGQRSTPGSSNPQLTNQSQTQSQQQAPPSSVTTPCAPQLPQQKPLFNPPVPFPLRRWEILPDATVASAGPPGSAAAAPAAKGENNDTAISLSLFGARKVV